MSTQAVQRYFSGLSRNTYLLACASLFADISTEMLYPVLPVFLTQTLNASGSIVGLVDGFAQATQNIVQGFAGALSDKLQRRKPHRPSTVSYIYTNKWTLMSSKWRSRIGDVNPPQTPGPWPAP
jgi:MFS family permease